MWADNIVWLNIFRGEEKIGDMGLVAKKVSMDCGIKNLSVMLFEFDATKLVPLRSRTNRFTHLAEYPETDYDISMLFDSDAAWADIHEAIMGQKKASALVKEAGLCGRVQRKTDPGGQEVGDHPPDHRIRREDADLPGDRGGRRPGDEETWQEAGS